MKKSIQTKSTFRNCDILNYRKNHTLKETAFKYGLTAERIRQIAFIRHQKRCEKHNRKYYNKCSHCLVESYEDLLDENGYDFVIEQCKKEAQNKKRDYLSVQRRIYLIKCLYDDYKASFTRISVLLDKDISTIKHLYAKPN